jgi:hypothetical protein
MSYLRVPLGLRQEIADLNSAKFLLCRFPSIPEITNVVVGRKYGRRLTVH